MLSPKARRAGGRYRTGWDRSARASPGRHAITAPSFTLTPLFVAGTDHIATAETRLIEHLADRWPLRVLPCPIKMPVLVQIVQWRPHQGRDEAILWFLQLLRRVGRELREARPAAAPESLKRWKSERGAPAQSWVDGQGGSQTNLEDLPEAD